MAFSKSLIVIALIATTCFFLVFASDPTHLQDFCVADPASSLTVNGFACKSPLQAQANDFFFSGLHVTGNTSNAFGSKLTPVNVAQIGEQNTLGLGVSLARIDYALFGINPPHTHPRAYEILTVIEGSLC